MIHATLTVDLHALTANWRSLKSTFSGAHTAAVVKANAYGLGAVPVARALQAAGCDRFFVATLKEGIALAQAFAETGHCPEIAVFHGADAGDEVAFVEHGLIPVINHIAALERWMLVTAHHTDAPYMLHVDTGMCRLGLSATDMAWLAAHGEKLLVRKPILLMSHLASANDAAHPANAKQLARFDKAKAILQNIPTSFCNSSGIFLTKEFHGDVARPGSALYGINPTPKQANPMQHVATLSAPVLVIRNLDCDETVGYGGTYAAKQHSRIAVVQMGYADGWIRALGNNQTATQVYVGDVACPMVGRVSMDMIAVDMSHLPEHALSVGMMVDLCCRQQPVDQIAEMAHTIGYEVFTGIGQRVSRVYCN